MDTIPILDLKNLPFNAYDRNSDEAEDVFRKFKTMLFSTGYCSIVNHGISDFVVKDVFANSQKFFRLPATIKNGYKKSDNKENSYAGYYISKNQAFRERFDITEEVKYPSQVPDFKKSFTEYRMCCNRVVKYLLILIAKCVQSVSMFQQKSIVDVNDDEFFVKKHSAIFNEWSSTKTTTHLSTIYYRNDENSSLKNVYLMNKHTDYSTFTLLTSSSPGLQILSNNGWFEVDSDPNHLVFHVGDLLEKWTGGLCSATVHRVLKLNTLEESRISIPYFIHPNCSTLVEPLCGNKSNHQAVIAEEYWKSQFKSNSTKHQFHVEKSF